MEIVLKKPRIVERTKKERKRLKQFLKYVLNSILFVIIIIICVLIHELGHVLGAIPFGGELYNIEFTGGSVKFWIFYVSDLERNISLISGPLIGSLISLFLVIIGHKRKIYGLKFGSFLYFITEFYYMGFSLILGYGDLYYLFNYNKNIILGLHFISIALLSCLILIYHKEIKQYLIKIKLFWVRKWTLKN